MSDLVLKFTYIKEFTSEGLAPNLLVLEVLALNLSGELSAAAS